MEIIHRFPQNEFLAPFVENLMRLCMHIIRTDNEENAVLCLKIIVELHKSCKFKSILEDHVQAFFDVVQEMYKNMKQAVADTFNVIYFGFFLFDMFSDIGVDYGL